MPSKVVVGTQWGDEGKGKIIDILAQQADVVVRAQGGNNAGHTVELAGEVYKLRTVPSGILYPKTLCLIGSGAALIYATPWVERGLSQFNNYSLAPVLLVVLVLIGVVADRR